MIITMHLSTNNVIIGKATHKLISKTKTLKKSVKTKKYSVTLKINLNNKYNGNSIIM